MKDICCRDVGNIVLIFFYIKSYKWTIPVCILVTQGSGDCLTVVVVVLLICVAHPIPNFVLSLQIATDVFIRDETFCLFLIQRLDLCARCLVCRKCGFGYFCIPSCCVSKVGDGATGYYVSLYHFIHSKIKNIVIIICANWGTDFGYFAVTLEKIVICSNTSHHCIKE